MIFDGKPIDEITNEKFDALVGEKTPEGQDLEFKATYTIKDKHDQLEVLRDIVSLVNGGGGYLIIGINDDGSGKAQGFVPHTKEDLNRMKQSIKELCFKHISERIPRLELKVRITDAYQILVIRIPESDQTPHMVTIDDRTDFYNRYDDGKRAMLMAEVRDAFRKNSIERGIDALSHKVDDIQRQLFAASYEIKESIPTENTSKPLFVTEYKDGVQLAKAMYEKMLSEVNGKPYFWVAATPKHLKPDILNVQSQEIKQIIESAPGSRIHGWNMELTAPIEIIPDGIQRGPKDYEYLSLYNNGHIEFWTQLDEHFCWRQKKEEFETTPELYPYPVIEYPVTFLRLYHTIVTEAKIDGDLIISLRYANLKGYRLRPYAPNQAGYMFADELKPYGYTNLELPLFSVDSSFDADKTAYELLKQVYSAFGLPQKAIPFFDGNQFTFPS